MAAFTKRLEEQWKHVKVQMEEQMEDQMEEQMEDQMEEQERVKDSAKPDFHITIERTGAHSFEATYVGYGADAGRDLKAVLRFTYTDLFRPPTSSVHYIGDNPTIQPLMEMTLDKLNNHQWNPSMINMYLYSMSYFMTVMDLI